MKRCPHCGHTNRDEAVRCWGCETSFDHADVEKPSQELPRIRRAPFFGLFGVAAPFVGFYVAKVVLNLKHFGTGADSAMAAGLTFYGIVFLSLLLGGVAGVVGLLRREAWRPASIVAALIGLGPWVFLLFMRALHSK